MQLLWEFRNEQRPAPEPPQPDEPIDNEPNAPHETSTAPPNENAQAQAAPAELIIQPPTMDVRQLGPKVMLHIHLSEEALLGYGNGKLATGGVGRFEGVGPVTVGQVRRFLADTNCDVRVQAVIDPQDTPPVDSYEIPRRIRKPCSCGCQPAASLTPLTPDAWNLITRSPMSRRLEVDRRAKLALAS